MKIFLISLQQLLGAFVYQYYRTSDVSLCKDDSKNEEYIFPAKIHDRIDKIILDRIMAFVPVINCLNHCGAFINLDYPFWVLI